jgi:hypothetical protein
MLFLKEAKAVIRPSLKTLLQQLVRVFVALFSPPFLVIRVAIWIVISNASMFTITSGMTPFITDELGIPPSTQGWIDIATYLCLSIGVVVYYKWFRYTSFRTIFAFSQIFTSLFFLCDYVLVKRWNVSIGIPDIAFIVTASAFNTVVDRLNAMPFLVMAGQLCPENMEATFFALLMSISNQGTTVAGIFGSNLLQVYDVRAKTKTAPANYEGLPTVILLRSAAILGALLFVMLLPNTSALNPTNVDSLKPTNPYIIKILKFADMYHPEKADQEDKVKGDDAKV